MPLPISLTPQPDPVPVRTMDQAAFDAAYAAYIAWKQTNTTEINTVLGLLSSTVGAGAVLIPYTFSTTTTDSDPGSGTLRLNQATQNTSTVIRADLLGSDAVDRTAVLDLFDDAVSPVKGYLRLVKSGDESKFLIFEVTGVNVVTGYRNISVVCRASSSANPFANSDAVLLYFTRSGEVPGAQLEGASVASATTTNIWSDAGRSRRITGANTISSFGTAPHVGAWQWLIFDSSATVSHGGNIFVQGGVTIQSSAGDMAFVYATTTTTFRLVFFRATNSGPGIQVFTSGATWTKPAGVSYVRVRATGGGGGGGGVDATSGSKSSGGAAGGYCEKIIAASSLGATETVTIGAGGAAGSSVPGGGGVGGSSSFGAHVSASGGGGGGPADSATVNTIKSAGGAASSGNININGQDGQSGREGGCGGGNPLASGGVPDQGLAGNQGAGYGAGGSGAISTGTARTGGVGLGGVVIVETFYI